MQEKWFKKSKTLAFIISKNAKKVSKINTLSFNQTLDNEAGYNVYLYYNEEDDCMSGTIKSPDK